MCLVPVKEMNMINVYEINHMRTAEMKSNEDKKKWETCYNRPHRHRRES